MGQAKERKARLGEWYGQPIGPGHPDFVARKKPEPIRPLLRFDMFDESGRVVGAKIDHFNAYGRRIEVEFVEGKRDSFWPDLEDEKVRGKLTIGSREFGDVELIRYTETGCVFLRSQPAQEEPSASESIVDPSDEQRTQEEPITEPRRTVRTIPDRRRMPLLFAALAMTALVGGVNIPEPEHRSKKRYRGIDTGILRS
jgi:hypothetical protein